MQIQVNSDNNIQHDEALEAWIAGVVESSLAHSRDYITRIEVHVGDENGGKSGPHDKRCMVEARLEGRSPVAVTDHAATLEKAVNGAAGKLGRLIESAVERSNRIK